MKAIAGPLQTDGTYTLTITDGKSVEIVNTAEGPMDRFLKEGGWERTSDWEKQMVCDVQWIGIVPTCEVTTVKQVIVMRTDLNMRKGKMVAQGAHAACSWLAGLVRDQSGMFYEQAPALTEPEQAWLHGRFTKICVGVGSEEELFAIHAEATGAGLRSKLIIDSGLTEFGGVETATCLAIGPDFADKIDPITGGLKLL